MLDLIVFGRAAAKRCKDIIKKKKKMKKIDKISLDKALSRFDFFRNAKGSISTSELRKEMQKTMQNYCSVFRNKKLLTDGKNKLDSCFKSKSNIKTNRFQYPNLQKKRIFVPELNKFITVKLSVKALKIIDRLGFFPY